MKSEAKTSTGATKSAIWAAEPIAMLTARSILFLEAKRIATQCSAALPTIATTITPMKNSREPDRIRGLGDRADEDLRHQADRDAGDASIPTERRTDQPKPSSSLLGVGRVEEGAVGRSENTRPAT